MVAESHLKCTDSGRNYGIDTLRIISMLFVIVLHMTNPGMGMKGANYELLSFPYWFQNCLRSFCTVAVNCFVLISGYYMSVQAVKPKKLFRLWLQVETYSVGIYLLCCFFHPAVSFSWKSLIRYAFPILSYQYWFFTMYFLLMVISPLLNTIIKNLEQNDYRKYLIVLIAVFTIIPTINIFGDLFGTHYGYSLIWFAVLYLIAGYIRKYSLPQRHYGKLYFCVCIILLLLKVASDILATRLNLAAVFGNLIFQYNSVFISAASISLFSFFLNLRPKFNSVSKKIISFLSSMSFGIYLFQEHNELRDILWSELVHLTDYIETPVRFLAQAGIALAAIAVVGMLLEFIRSTITNYICKLGNLIIGRLNA